MTRILYIMTCTVFCFSLTGENLAEILKPNNFSSPDYRSIYVKNQEIWLNKIQIIHTTRESAELGRSLSESLKEQNPSKEQRMLFENVITNHAILDKLQVRETGSPTEESEILEVLVKLQASNLLFEKIATECNELFSNKFIERVRDLQKRYSEEIATRSSRLPKLIARELAENFHK